MCRTWPLGPPQLLTSCSCLSSAQTQVADVTYNENDERGQVQGKEKQCYWIVRALLHLISGAPLHVKAVFRVSVDDVRPSSQERHRCDVRSRYVRLCWHAVGRGRAVIQFLLRPSLRHTVQGVRSVRAGLLGNRVVRSIPCAKSSPLSTCVDRFEEFNVLTKPMRTPWAAGRNVTTPWTLMTRGEYRW